LAFAGGAAVLLTSCGSKQVSATQAGEEQVYTCGMHPWVIVHKPGNCPVCGMPLERVRKQVATTSPPAQRKVKYYKSTMNAGEVSPVPAKDSMGMDMEPVY
jgi:hydrogenase maturation factor